jgi:hypothetical protein
LNEVGASVGGSISVGNFKGPEGQCTNVVDSPSEEHAMKVTDAQSRSGVLAFKGARGAQFEMTLDGAEDAQLKFLGTPVEDNPWKLKRAR